MLSQYQFLVLNVINLIGLGDQARTINRFTPVFLFHRTSSHITRYNELSEKKKRLCIMSDIPLLKVLFWKLGQSS